MFDDVVEQRERPGRAAFEKAEAQRGKTARDAAHEQRAAEVVGAGCKAAEVVEDVVARRVAIGVEDRRRVTHRRHFELDALRPERIVVVRRIDRDRAREIRRLVVRARHRADVFGADHDRFVAEFVDRELEFGDRFFRRERRDQRHRPHAVGDFAEHVGVEHVRRAAERLAHFVVLIVEPGNAGRRVEMREVEAEIVHARAEELRQHRHRAVARVRPRRHAPPEAAAGLIVLLVGRALPVALDDARSGEILEEVFDREARLDDVRVAVDHGVIEPRADLRTGEIGEAGHSHASDTVTATVRSVDANPYRASLRGGTRS